MALDAVLLDVLKRHCSALGDTFTAQGGSKVLCRPSNRVVFAKTGRADQVLGEAESLDAMYRASQAAGHQETLIPTIHAFGKTQDGSRGFLVTDYKDLQSSLGKQAQRTLGRKLAEMHRHGTSDNGMYGFSRPTHCGETEQDNTWTASWPEFWADRRIGDLVRRSGDAELAKLELQLREKVYPLIFNDEAMRSVRPSIIHGDLWSGNSGTDHDTGEPIIFDPSSSYSHNEAELGIMRMFGGYTSDFFDSYHEVMPKAQPYYAERIEMYEAYHHLNHFVIFGGSYKSGTVRIFKKLIAWAEKEGKKNGGGGGGGGPGGGGGDEEGDNSGGHGGPRGLRGGGASSSESKQHNTQSILAGAHHLGPPPPPGPGASGTSMLASLAPFHQAEASTNIADQCKTKLPPSPSQVADFFSQMACYIWFSNGHPLSSMPVTPSKSPNTAYVPLQSSPLAPRHGAHPYASRPQRTHTKHTSYGGPSHHPSYAASNDLSRAVEEHLRSLGKPRDPTLRRLQPRSRFLRFTRELLATTQVSNSVILLALIYIIRLKSGHPGLQGRDGSEFRLAVSSLMLANKILDDNTYLNKTWAEISGLPLIELGKAELEFWLGLKMRLHVTTDEYQAGLQELETLAEHRSQAVRERDASMRRAAQQQQANMAPYLSHQPSMSFPDILAQQHTVRRSLGNIHAHHFSPASMGTAFPSSPEGLRSAIPFHEPGAYPYATSPVAAQPHFHLPPPSPLSQVGPSNESIANFAGASDFAYSTPATSEHSINQLDGISGLESTWQPTGIASAQLQPLSISHEPWGTTPPRTAHSASVQFDGSRSSHTSSSFSGLKRDFERTSLGAGSPVESSRTNKRFAAEPSAADDLHHYRISSSLSRQSHSPTDNRGAHRQYRHGSRERFQSMQHHRLSVSPTASRLSSVSYQASPLVGNAATSARQVPLNDSATHTNGYLSAFQTALTPDFLAQPLDSIQHQRSGPLQYYSLAAGQPYGVIGSYMPPELPYQMQSMSAGSQFDRPIAGVRRASNAGFTAAANAAVSAAAATNNGGGLAYSSSYNDSLLSSGRLQIPERPAIHQQPSAPAQLSAPPLGIASDAIKTVRSTVDNRQVPYNGTAPFVSDAHAWPLTHTSSNFLYPHHFAH